MSGDSYADYLTSLKSRRFYVCPYQGNSGDGLIVKGTHGLLQQLGIATTRVPAKADVILYPGGSPALWPQGLDTWRDAWRRYPDKDFIVGPATFQSTWFDWATVVRNEGATVRALFARDPASYGNLTNASLGSRIHLGLSHDPAFFLRQSPWIEELKQASTQEYALLCFRRDHEGCAESQLCAALLPKRLRDLVQRYSRRQRWRAKVTAAKLHEPTDEPQVVCDVAALNFDMFVQGIQRASHVHTDRLHVMIMASLLGKQVFAYETAYRKLEAVYEHSMKDWADVSFHAI